MDLKPVVPFEPIITSQIPQGENWVAQIKWDGVRMLAYFNGHEVRFVNRRLHDRTKQYPELGDIQKYCSASSVILDGEIIAFDDKRPSFHEIMKRDSLRKSKSIELAIKQIPVTYMIFDVLYYNGSWIVDQKLSDRQQILQHIITENPNVQIVQNFPDGDALFQVMKQHDMEGIVCKDLESQYVIHGKDKRWQKKKILRDLFAAVGGATFRNGVVNALLLGLYDGSGHFVYIGHVGTGKLNHKDWENLTEKILTLTIDSKPFANQPERIKGAIWVKPEIVVKVQFLEWTPGATMRHPSIQAIVDVHVSECTFSQSK
ncbi:RNA ligase family protein [Brevibacillus massiliensis]|jgi:bifunctional non-homologous end joining protein LigD|uniref:ATP-dependent DNA ligase n=1 Tax=Brevibacillus massiliensis TaxID=1118054 RepID=UPI0002EAD13A|nr:RNA ligase family protein [Brevibacillus massiliensis]